MREEEIEEARPMAAADICRLRQEVAHHPVHRWAAGPIDRTTLLVHQAFCRWASAVLANDLKIAGPDRHLAETRRALRRRGAGRSLDTFIDAVDAGHHPASALNLAGAPTAAQPLVEAVWAVGAGGSEAARLGALALGLPCCIVDTGPALDRLGVLAADEPVSGAAQAEAEAAAMKVLLAQLDLYQGALQVIRQRHMANHPSMWRPPARPAPVASRSLQLLPS
jgi:hypothetical protein